jgi:hypothetical protein
MFVHQSRLLLEDDEARIVATVRSDDGHFTPFDLVIGVPRAYVGWLDLSGSPFVPTLLLLAAVLKEGLRLEGPVSPILLSNTTKACELYQSWWGIPPVSIDAEAIPAVRCKGDGTALFFTRGVDSWYSALVGTAKGQSERISHLLYAPDLDRQYTPPLRQRALRLTREAAACIDLPLISISFNGRALLDRFVSWELSHGGVLAGIGLALGGGFETVLIASTLDTAHLMPWGSHPDLDPLWSTERTSLRVDGIEVTRTNKVRAIVAAPFVPSRLKVCWCADIDANCGRCEKCVRTQCALAIAGALERAPVFLQPLTVQAVTDLPGLEHATAHDLIWQELCESFPLDPALADLREAACGRLPSWHPLSTTPKARAESTLVIEAPAGAAVSLLPASASDVLPAPVTTRAGEPGSNASNSQLEITWTIPAPDRIPLPLRPPSTLGLDILDACRAAHDRPIPWCLIAYASPETARLLERLTASWGPGVACLTRADHVGGDHGISRQEASLIQRHAETRVWWGGGEYLDPFLVLEALRHGCLPLQCVPDVAHDALTACLPASLSHFTIAVPEKGLIPPISRHDRAARLDGGLSLVLAGNLERDLTQVTASLRCGIL